VNEIVEAGASRHLFRLLAARESRGWSSYTRPSAKSSGFDWRGPHAQHDRKSLSRNPESKPLERGKAAHTGKRRSRWRL